MDDKQQKTGSDPSPGGGGLADDCSEGGLDLAAYSEKGDNLDVPASASAHDVDRMPAEAGARYS